MRTHTRTYATPKAGNSETEQQDFFALLGDAGYSDTSPQRFAISDGATDAIFSGAWAQLLTKAWVEKRLELAAELQPQLEPLIDQWRNSVQGDDLPWWAEQKIEKGAFATLAGLTLWDDNGKYWWEYESIGDSCLIVIERNKMTFSGPLTQPIQFESAPYLIGSNVSYNGELAGNIHRHRSSFADTDIEFLLMTDAVACYFLKAITSGIMPGQILQFADSQNAQSSFLTWVSSLRESGAMKNDDVTILSILIVP
jgi:hypothetical protein